MPFLHRSSNLFSKHGTAETWKFTHINKMCRNIIDFADLVLCLQVSALLTCPWARRRRRICQSALIHCCYSVTCGEKSHKNHTLKDHTSCFKNDKLSFFQLHYHPTKMWLWQKVKVNCQNVKLGFSLMLWHISVFRITFKTFKICFPPHSNNATSTPAVGYISVFSPCCLFHY